MFKVGTKVTCSAGATGIVVEVIEDRDTLYPILVERSDETGFRYSYSRKGERLIGSTNIYDILPLEETSIFKVGDRVHCTCYGEGVILPTPSARPDHKDELYVKFDNHTANWWYHLNGTMYGFENSEEDKIMKVETTFSTREFKLGDLVVNGLGRFGAVIEVNRVSEYTIRVKFMDETCEVFTSEGKYGSTLGIQEELNIRLAETSDYQIKELQEKVAKLEAELAQRAEQSSPTEAAWKPKYSWTCVVETSTTAAGNKLQALAKILAYKAEFDPEGAGYCVYLNTHGKWDSVDDHIPNLGTVNFSREGASALVDKLNKGLVTF